MVVHMSWMNECGDNTFTFSHLADAFIQSDLQLGVHKLIIFIYLFKDLFIYFNIYLMI